MTPKKQRDLVSFALLGLLLTSTVGLASGGFYEVERLYQLQDFHQVVDILDEMKLTEKSDKAEAEYFRGLALKGMGDYENASKAYAKAIKLGNKRDDLYYEYGQSLYAANNLELAQKAFKRSIKKGFKPIVSQYYIAYTHQILENFKKAKMAYAKVVKQSKDKDLKQVASFQLAEVFFALATPRDNPADLVKRYVLPQFKKALEIDPNSRLAKDIKKRELEVRRRYGLDPNTLLNGRRIPTKRYDLSLRQGFSYDSNIIEATDQVSAQSTQKDSFVITTNAKAAYTFIFKKRFLVKPELRAKVLRHTNQDEEDVFRNDTWNLVPALRTSFEHKINQKPANLFIDYEHGYVERDADRDKSLSFYARYHQVSLGEKFRLFSFGDTTIKAQRREYNAFSTALSSTSTNVGVDQVAVLPNKHILLGFALASFIRSDVAISELDYYLLRFDYLIPDILPKYTLHLTGGFSFLSTPDASLDAARGLEIEYNPAVRLIKKVTKNFNVSFGHSYTKRNSDDTTNRVYSKHTSDIELKYSF